MSAMGELAILSEEGAVVHHYHHRDDDGPRVNMKVEKNSKGYNWEVTVTGAASVDDALDIIQHSESVLKAMYGEEGKA